MLFIRHLSSHRLTFFFVKLTSSIKFCNYWFVLDQLATVTLTLIVEAGMTYIFKMVIFWYKAVTWVSKTIETVFTVWVLVLRTLKHSSNWRQLIMSEPLWVMGNWQICWNIMIAGHSQTPALRYRLNYIMCKSQIIFALKLCCLSSVGHPLFSLCHKCRVVWATILPLKFSHSVLPL